MFYNKIPKGSQDILPKDNYNLNLIKQSLQKKFLSANCKFITSSGLEYYDTFAEIKNKIPQNKMFKISDTDGNLMVLRPDTTLAIARIAGTKLEKTNQKLCYFCNKYTYSASGISSREVLQAGVEFLGVSSAFSDAQTIAFAIECLKETGLNDFIIDIGHVDYFKGVISESGLSGSQIDEVSSFVNGKDIAGATLLLEKYKVNKQIIDTISSIPLLFGGAEILDKAQKLTKNAVALNAVKRLKQVNDLLCSFGLEKYISFDLGTIKSLSYYSGVIFSGLTSYVGSPILAGGRYDTLAGDFGKNIPAVGFAIGLTRVLSAIETQSGLKDIPAPDYVLASEIGYEKQAYDKYLADTKNGKVVDLFTGDIQSAKGYAKDICCDLYITSKEGFKKL